MRPAQQAILALVVICCIATGGFLVWRFIQADSCLDGGGRWNEEKNVCEHQHAPWT
jgi:hypothetical protein